MSTLIPTLYTVVEHEPSGKQWILTGFENIGAAQQHIARTDPAARRFLTVESMSNVYMTTNVFDLRQGDTIVMVEHGNIYFTRRTV